MQLKLLNDIVREIIGEQAGSVLDILIGKKDVNEFLIAKKLKLTINQTRNIFYKMSNFGLVTFTRKKDKKKGWYTYFWTLNSYRSLELLEKRLSKEIENLKNQLRNRQTRRFYLCKTCKTEVTEETALLHNFTCQECGQVYQLNEDAKIFNLLKNRIEKLEKQRADVLQELGLIMQEQEKQIEKKSRKDKKKKDKEKKARRKKEKRARKREEKKAGKQGKIKKKKL